MKVTKESLQELVREVLSEAPPGSNLQKVRGVNGRMLAKKMLAAPGVENLLPIVKGSQDMHKIDFLTYLAQVVGIDDLSKISSKLGTAGRRMSTGERAPTTAPPSGTME